MTNSATFVLIHSGVEAKFCIDVCNEDCATLIHECIQKYLAISGGVMRLHIEYQMRPAGLLCILTGREALEIWKLLVQCVSQMSLPQQLLSREVVSFDS